jgi:hypothetical protein
MALECETCDICTDQRFGVRSCAAERLCAALAMVRHYQAMLALIRFWVAWEAMLRFMAG